MTEPAPLPLADFKALIGHEIGVSRWFEVAQPRIDAFADLTEDWQFIHVDPARAKAEAPFGGTIAHGFLTLALLPAMAYEVIPRVAGATMGVNYGFDKLRFVSPVPAGSRVRGRFSLMSADERTQGEITLKYGVQVEIDGGARPAIAAEWLARQYITGAQT